ncbi:MAG: hypothetical protein RRY76_02215 [Clostridia bacterium]
MIRKAAKNKQAAVFLVLGLVNKAKKARIATQTYKIRQKIIWNSENSSDFKAKKMHPKNTDAKQILLLLKNSPQINIKHATIGIIKSTKISHHDKNPTRQK